MDGLLSTRGIWVQADEGASLTGAACAPNCPTGAWRGAPDRRGGTSRLGAERAGECDGLTGLPEATRGHLAPVRGPDLRGYHLIRSSMRFVPYKDHEEGRRCSQAHPHRAGRGGGPWGLGGLRRVRPRARYPQTVATWERAQAGSRRSQSFPPTGRRVVPPPLAQDSTPPPTPNT